MKNVLKLLLTALIFNTAFAEESNTWLLPLTINDQNTTVGFDVNTTWHVVHGKISNSTGTISLLDQKSPLSVVSEIHFQVKSFDTGWDKRNESLWDHMKADKFPEVILKTTSVVGDCNPEKVGSGDCKAKLVGTLSICDVTKPVEVDVVISKKTDSYVVAGYYSFKWADYNVDDPSILVAKVDPVVNVSYSVKLPIATK